MNKEIEEVESVTSNKKTTRVRHDLIKVIAKDLDITQIQAEDSLDAVIDAIKYYLMENEIVKIQGFATFEPITTKPQRRRNPTTGEVFVDEAKSKVKFKQSKYILKDY